MKHNTQAVARELDALLQNAHSSLNQLTHFPEKQLSHHPAGQGWNALECLEHLNQYAAYYLPALEKVLNPVSGKATATYSSGWIGEYFAKLMRAENAKPGKMKAPASKNPAGKVLVREAVLATFQKDLAQVKVLLDNATRANWNAVRIPTSLSPLIRLNLGDTLRFYVYHLDRHVQQAMRAAQ